MIGGMRNLLQCVFGAALAIHGAASDSQAQAPLAEPAAPRVPIQGDMRFHGWPRTACTDAIPESMMAPVAVYAYVERPSDPVAGSIRPAAQTPVARMAGNVRATFGAKGDQLGWGEPRVTWEGVTGELRVIAHRDGRLAWKEPEGDSLRTTGIRAVAAALRAVHDSGGRVAWPESLTGDSAEFTISLRTPIFDRNGKVSSPRLDRPEPLFLVMQPWAELVFAIAGSGGPGYPRGPKAAGAEAIVNVSFVVDTSGRAEVSTLKDIWPEHQPRHTGKEAQYYEAFIDSIREHLRTSARFLPARIGGCGVRVWVQQSFEFRLDR